MESDRQPRIALSAPINAVEAVEAAALPRLSRPLGRHLGTGPGMEQTIKLAMQLGCTAAQIFPGNPKGWRHVPLPVERAVAMRGAWAASGVCPLVIHAPYLINLASPEEPIYAHSRQALRNSLSRAVELGAPHVIVHLGSHKGSGQEAGAARIVQAVHGALDGMPDWLYLLLENNVGSGNSMAGSLQSLATLLGDIAHPRTGVCIDTAHLWGAGHDISTAEGVERVIEELDRTIGVPRLRILHVNDSPMALESHRDQHTHLGQGNIGYSGLGAWLTHPALACIPAILETPESKPEQEAIRLRTAALLCLGAVDEARDLQETALPAGLQDGDAAASPAPSGTVPEMPGEQDDGGSGQ
jgi:deoxyribonuclease-4